MAMEGFDSAESNRLLGIYSQQFPWENLPDNEEFKDVYAPRDYDFEVKNFDRRFQSEDEYLDYLDKSTSTSPAMLTDIPTSSTNSLRPRTVAAGYQLYESQGTLKDRQLGKMTVMFRDGTLYNYYDVTPGEWESFHASISKGSPWLNKGFAEGKQTVDGLFISKPQGPADISLASVSVVQTIRTIGRAAQVRFSSGRTESVRMRNASNTDYIYRESFKPTISATGVKRGVVTKAGVKRAGFSKGANPNKNAGRNPYQK